MHLAWCLLLLSVASMILAERTVAPVPSQVECEQRIKYWIPSRSPGVMRRLSGEQQNCDKFKTIETCESLGGCYWSCYNAACLKVPSDVSRQEKTHADPPPTMIMCREAI